MDSQILRKNITAMAEHAREHHLQLRPHAKTHKMVEIGQKQLMAGSVGLSVATIGEAETFVEAGVRDIFIAYPLWLTLTTAAQLSQLARRASLSIGTDSVAAVKHLGEYLNGRPTDLGVLIEINSGHNRSGVSPTDCVEIAEAIREQGLDFKGVFTFPGHSYGPGLPQKAVSEEEQALKTARDLLIEAGFKAEVVSGGSSPTATLTDGGVLTEMRPGVYVFGDAQQFELGRIGWEDIALTVLTTVVSRDEGKDGNLRRIIVDAGSKIMGGDRPAWTTGFGRVLGTPDARITALSEHHGTILWPEDQALPEIGTQLRVVPNHVCVAVNLVDEVTVISGQEILGLWQVAARGLNT